MRCNSAKAARSLAVGYTDPRNIRHWSHTVIFRKTKESQSKVVLVVYLMSLRATDMLQTSRTVVENERGMEYRKITMYLHNNTVNKSSC